jgi:large subunit ribosomal protein L32
LRAVNAAVCPNCGTARLPHAACSNCGYVRPGLTIKLGKED